MKIKINVMSDDIKKSKAFVRYLMKADMSTDHLVIKEFRDELSIESEKVICKTVKCTLGYRGNKYHKLYVDSDSEIDNNIFDVGFRFGKIGFRLPNGITPLYFHEAIEYVRFDDYIK